MCKKILYASARTREGGCLWQIRPGRRINFLYGKEADACLWTLASIFGDTVPGISPDQTVCVRAGIAWPEGVVFRLAGELREDSSPFGICFLEASEMREQWAKAFHKQRFLESRSTGLVFDPVSACGRECAGQCRQVRDAFWNYLRQVSKEVEDRPLFLLNFLERLEETEALEPILEGLAATNRQVFIALPHYYPLEALPISEGKSNAYTVHRL